MFHAIYESPWVATAAVALATLFAFALWLRKKPFLTAYIALFTIEILADALRSGSWSPLTLLKSSWAGTIDIAFILVGDFRYFLLVERFVRRPTGALNEATSLSTWGSAIAFTLLVPAVSAIVNRSLPSTLNVRWTYLTYEAMFLALAIVLRAAVLPRRLAGAPLGVRAWLLRVASFEVAQYALWALADVIILFTGADAGFALRIVPNVMYYAAFLPFVAWTAPPEVDA